MRVEIYLIKQKLDEVLSLTCLFRCWVLVFNKYSRRRRLRSSKHSERHRQDRRTDSRTTRKHQKFRSKRKRLACVANEYTHCYARGFNLCTSVTTLVHNLSNKGGVASIGSVLLMEGPRALYAHYTCLSRGRTGAAAADPHQGLKRISNGTET